MKLSELNTGERGVIVKVYGRCDRAGYEGDYKDKDWVNRLAPGESFHASYTIEIL